MRPNQYYNIGFEVVYTFGFTKFLVKKDSVLNRFSNYIYYLHETKK